MCVFTRWCTGVPGHKQIYSLILAPMFVTEAVLSQGIVIRWAGCIRTSFPRDWNPPGLGFTCNTRLAGHPQKGELGLRASKGKAGGIDESALILVRKKNRIGSKSGRLLFRVHVFAQPHPKKIIQIDPWNYTTNTAHSQTGEKHISTYIQRNLSSVRLHFLPIHLKPGEEMVMLLQCKTS